MTYTGSLQIKDLQDQISILGRQLETLKGTNATITNDNQLLVEKVRAAFSVVQKLV